MAFRVAKLPSLVKFNSSTSCNFLEGYEEFVRNKIATEKSEPSTKTFSPSSFRCERKQWFRLRGAVPDPVTAPDTVLEFTAEVGTARHRVIQQNLKEYLGDDWIDVAKYIAENVSKEVKCEVSGDGLETLVEFFDPPVRFAVDGIVRIDGEYYLLEIKTSNHGAFEELSDPKSIHIDQIKCYSALLGITNVLVLYEDRQYGEMKCYQVKYTSSDHLQVFNKMAKIQSMAENNLAPERLPFDDYACTNCEYRKKCKEWG